MGVLGGSGVTDDAGTYERRPDSLRDETDAGGGVVQDSAEAVEANGGAGGASPDGEGTAEGRRVGGTFSFDAPAEVVFGVLTDPDRTQRWLPPGMHAEAATTRQVRLRVGSQVHEYGVEIVPDALRVRWRSLDDSGLRGTAEVRDAPAGGSLVQADVDVPADVSDDQRVHELLQEAMRHLQRDVSDNFNAG